jgi:hypothetical protein
VQFVVQRRSQRRSSLRTLASSAPKGSSSSSTRGSTASARASAMRWRWPPDSCDGKRSASQSSCTSLSSACTLVLIAFGRALGARLHAQAEGDVVEHGHVAEQRVVLEHEADLALAHMGAGGILAIEQHLARVGLFQPGDDAQQRRLAAARRAEQRDQFAGRESRGKCRRSAVKCRTACDVSDDECS